MTFGQIKSIIENNLLESYKADEKDFKKSLKEFKHNVLNNKSMSKIYALYEQLSSPQGLSESDAKEFLNEGISLIQQLLPSVRIPSHTNEKVSNNYSDIDTLVYTNRIDLFERIGAKKNIINVLTSSKNSIKESINIPIKSMVNIANQTLTKYIETLDESAKKEFMQIVSKDPKELESEFESIRENAINKLQNLLIEEPEFEIKTKISETIDKLKVEKFDQMNFLRLKNLVKSI